ncbi:MAG: glutathione S-transferase [Hyphomicrobiaceae bacterium]
MMIIRSAGPSPFGRKVKIAAKVTGLFDDMTIEVTDTLDPDDSIRRQNPLGKIPTLVLEDGSALYDSRVICEYLDSRSKTGRIIPDGHARWDALRQQALGDGIMDAGVLLVYEKRLRPEDKHHAPWQEYQQDKIDRTLTALEAAPPGLDTTPTIGQIAIACALGYLDFRFDGAWRSTHPALVSWLDAFEAAVPAFDATRPAA